MTPLMRLSAVIGINSQNGKREQPTCTLKGCQHGLLAAMQERQAFRPAGGYICERQGIQIAAIDVCATMSYHIRFQKTWLGLIPCLEGADGNLLLEQRSGSRRGEAALSKRALGTRGADLLSLRSWRAVACGTHP
jgi:hypothetical protein